MELSRQHAVLGLALPCFADRWEGHPTCQLPCSNGHTRSRSLPLVHIDGDSSWKCSDCGSPARGSSVRSSACDWNDRNGLKPSPERAENLTYKESFGIGVKLPQ